MHAQSNHEIPEALRRHNEERQRDPEQVVSGLGGRARVVVLWRRRDRATSANALDHLR